jgi:CDP-glycerol glycerophosphotransferase (TagB/SpsB family)
MMKINFKMYTNKIYILIMFKLVSLIGLTLSIIPHRRKYIVFIGHHGRFNGNSKYLYSALSDKMNALISAPNNMKIIFIVKSGMENIDKNSLKNILFKVSSKRDWLQYFLYLWFAKALVITTPGYDWKSRRVFAFKAKTILVSNGIPLKSPGILSKNFDSIKSIKYTSFWSDIDQLWVSSQFERYMASSSLEYPIEKIFINGAARQTIFARENFNNNKSQAKEKIKHILGDVITGKRIVLVALTHRDYMKDANFGAFDSIEKLYGYNSTDFIEYLVQNKIHLVIRDHALGKSKKYEKYEKISSYIGHEILPELNDIILAFDVIITDYSGLYLDLLKLDIQLGLLRFPTDKFVKERGLILPDKVLSGPLVIESMESLLNLFIKEGVDNSIWEFRKGLSNLFFEVDFLKCIDKNLECIEGEILK